jgi:hypothetical protein
MILLYNRMAVEILSEVDRFMGPPEAAGAALVAGVSPSRTMSFQLNLPRKSLCVAHNDFFASVCS